MARHNPWPRVQTSSSPMMPARGISRMSLSDFLRQSSLSHTDLWPASAALRTAAFAAYAKESFQECWRTSGVTTPDCDAGNDWPQERPLKRE